LPRRSAGLLLLAAALVAAAVGWTIAAALLWDTGVPDDLRLPDLDSGDYFSAAELEEARSYESVIRLFYLGSLVAGLLVLAVYAKVGLRFVRESAAGPIGTGMLLAMLGLGLVWLTLLPFGILELWWQRRHDLTEAGYADVVVGGWLALGVEFAGISLAILIVMGLARPLPRLWWIPGAAAFVGLAALGAFVYPYLGGGEPLRDPVLVEAAERFEQEDDLPDVPIEVAEVSAYTTAPNAQAAGLGPSRRVILWDTILDGRFEDDELVFVIGHELGHHESAHLPKALAWYALFAFPGAWLIALATRRRGGMREPAAVPVALLVLVGLQLLASPAFTAISRNMEREADWIALDVTEDPDAGRDLFEGFSTALLADPDPPSWTTPILQTHPAILDRIAMVEAWEERNGR
jgi:STE24 endopeptidase